MRSRPFSMVVMAVMLAALGACATRTAPPVVSAPRHPDFLFPVSPEGTAAGLVDRVDRGWRFLQGGDLRNAEREFAAVVRADPALESGEAAMGYLSLARGDAARALERFDRALVSSARYTPALVGRGHALMALQREGEALSSFEAALAADPSLTELQARVDVLRFRATQDLLARATAAADAGRLDDARVAYEQAIAASPDSAFLYRDLAVVERRAGRTEAAVERLRRAIDLDGTDTRAMVALGDILDGQGDVVGALALYDKAVAVDPAAVPSDTLARARDRVALLALPEQYRAIPAAVQVTRGDLAAIIGVRLQALVARAAQRQVVITDIRGHWAQNWITAVVRASVMETLPNYQFDPSGVVRRGDLARTASRILSLVAALNPAAARKWQDARITVSDVAPTHLSYRDVSTVVAAGVMALEGNAFRLLEPVSGTQAMDVIGRLETLAR